MGGHVPMAVGEFWKNESLWTCVNNEDDIRHRYKFPVDRTIVVDRLNKRLVISKKLPVVPFFYSWRGPLESRLSFGLSFFLLYCRLIVSPRNLTGAGQVDYVSNPQIPDLSVTFMADGNILSLGWLPYLTCKDPMLCHGFKVMVASSFAHSTPTPFFKH